MQPPHAAVVVVVASGGFYAFSRNRVPTPVAQFALGLERPLWKGGDTLFTRWSSAEVPGGALSVRAPSPIVITSPNPTGSLENDVQLSPSDPALGLRWTGGNVGTVVVTNWLYNEAGPTLRCEFAASAGAAVAAAGVALIANAI